jgi:uncharacterized delta-60 repeat protein
MRACTFAGFFLRQGSSQRFALALNSAQAAQPGTFDPSFGNHGEVTTDFGPGGEGEEGARAIALQPDGKIVVAGRSNSFSFGLVRYKANGSLDRTFGPNGNGKVTDFPNASQGAAAVAVQPDGKILAVFGVNLSTAPYYEFARARYLPNGSLDPGFGQGGKLTTDFGGYAWPAAMSLEPGGKILVAGHGHR